jgi:hypothetical protein
VKYEYTYSVTIGARTISGRFVGSQPMTEAELNQAVAAEIEG